MTPLRQRLIEEIALRGYSPKTQQAYVHAVACLAQHYGRPPDGLSDEELRAYLLQLHLKGDKAAQHAQRGGQRHALLLPAGVAPALYAPGAQPAAPAPGQTPAQGLHRGGGQPVAGGGLPQPQASRLPHDRLRRRACGSTKPATCGPSTSTAARARSGSSRAKVARTATRCCPSGCCGSWKLTGGCTVRRRLALPQHPPPAGADARRHRPEDLLPGGGARRPARQGRHPLPAPFLRHALDGSGPAALRAQAPAGPHQPLDHQQVSAREPGAPGQNQEPARPTGRSGAAAAPPSLAPSPTPYPAGRRPELARVVSPFDELPTR